MEAEAAKWRPLLRLFVAWVRARFTNKVRTCFEDEEKLPSMMAPAFSLSFFPLCSS
jgi:hypothetical protein